MTQDPKPLYREFMRARRPELYSDTLTVEESESDLRQFEYHLDTLTSRKQEVLFEHFARALAEKELCPNLLPQTGPTGGGDSKVDTETYPVAEAIASRWYEGDSTKAATERWAFAISAKKKWKPKVLADVQKIAATGRPYSVIYFITNQFVPDKARSETEASLKAPYGIDVRILDRSWIVARVSQNKRWGLVADTLQLEFPSLLKRAIGPLDLERQRDLEALDLTIGDSATVDLTPQTVEDSLTTALLARGLERPWHEVGGRFSRAERLALDLGAENQVQRIRYHRAWTAIWWFNDTSEAVRLYDLIATSALQSQWVWDLDHLVNLWFALAPSLGPDPIRTAALRAALRRHADDEAKETSALWARTQLLLIDLVIAVNTQLDLDPVLSALSSVFEKVANHVEFPVEPIVRLVDQVAEVIPDSEAYDVLAERVMEVQRHRHGDIAEGEGRLKHGFRKLDNGNVYDAINDLAKAQLLLAHNERRGQFIVAQAATGLAYEAAGLLFAARANLVFALDRCLYAYFKDGAIDRRALGLVRKLAWLELQLGRVPYLLAWLKWLPLLMGALCIGAEERTAISEEVRMIDRVLGILILKTPYALWSKLTKLPDLLHSFDLQMSRSAALFMLGHEGLVKTEYGTDEDLNHFFGGWANVQAADDLPDLPLWHIGPAIFNTSVLGCRIEIIARGAVPSALLGESIAAFIEAFYSTAIKGHRLISPRESLVIEVRQSDEASSPFALRSVEDDCGESKLVVTHPVAGRGEWATDRFERAIFGLLAQVTAHLRLDVSNGVFEELLSKHRAQDRAFHAARSIIAVHNIFDNEPPGRADDWLNDAELHEYPFLRKEPWLPPAKPVKDAHPNQDGTTAAPDPGSRALSGADALKHRDITTISPINTLLWEAARWKGVGVATTMDSPLPVLVLAFENIAAARKIFRSWRKRVGAVDREGWIGVTVITGINRSRPFDYRVVIGTGEKFLVAASPEGRLVATLQRVHEMAPASSTNIDNLAKLYEKAGRVLLQPASMTSLSPDAALEQEDAELSLQLAELTVVPAWKIDADSPLIGAMDGIDDPVIPPDEVEIPFSGLRQRLRDLELRQDEMD